jgi:molybdopterin converting factor small subunit
MELHLTYFGQLAEITGDHNEIIEISGASVHELKEVMKKKYPRLQQLSFVVAQDNQLLNENDKITGSQLDVFPPFSGG